METTDLLLFALAIISGTLAVVSLIFGWRMFLKSTDMQVKAEAALSEISQKVATIVEQSYKFTDNLMGLIPFSKAELSQEETEKQAQRQEEQKKAIVDEATQKAVEAIEKMGVLREQVNPEQIKQLEEKLESIIAKTAEETTESEYEARGQKIDMMIRRLLENMNKVANVKYEDIRSVNPQDVPMQWLQGVLEDKELGEGIHGWFKYLGVQKATGYRTVDFHEAMTVLNFLHRQVRIRVRAHPHVLD